LSIAALNKRRFSTSWKATLKALIPVLRHRPTVLRLHMFADAAKNLLARLRHAAGASSKLDFQLPQRRKRIVFVSGSPLRREPKFSHALKRAGWDVILVQSSKSQLTDFSDYTDVLTYDCSWEATKLVRSTGGQVAHHFAASFDETSVRLARDKPARTIMDFYDYFYGMAGHRPCLEDRFSRDIAMQRYCYQKTDAICAPDLQLQFDRPITQVGRGKPAICFPNYCWDTLELPAPRNEGAIHVVQIGFMEFEAHSGEDVGSFHVTRDLVRAGCHFHIYLHPHFPLIGTPEFQKLFVDYIGLQQETGRVHFHPTVPTHEIARELSQYDFGFAMMNGPTYGMELIHHNPQLMPLIGSARCFDYVDAGLPFLSDGMMAFNRHLFRDAFIDGTRLIANGQIMEDLARRPSRETMLKIRSQRSAKNNITRLIRFYEELGA
jgi:hypothetical protein